MEQQADDPRIDLLRSEIAKLQQQSGSLDDRLKEQLRSVLSELWAELQAPGKQPGQHPALLEDLLQLLDELPSMIWRSGTDALCNYFNKSWLAFTGRTLEKELYDGWVEGIHPQDREQVLRFYLEAFHARRAFEMEYRIRHRSGEYRWILDTGRPFHNSDGEFGGFIGSCYDLTEYKNIERALKESEAMFKGLFEYAPDAVITVNDQGKITLVNQQAQEIFGYRWEELLGHPIEILMPEEFRLRHMEHVSEYLALPRVRPMGVNLALYARRKDGNRFPVDIMLGPLLSGTGTTILATIRDTTERKRAEEELRLYRDRLEELVEARTAELQKEITRRRHAEAALHTYADQLRRSNRDLQDFASIASHDLQEPLRKIQAFSDRLKLKYEPLLGKEGLDYLERMQSAAARMQTMLNDLLVYSRLTTRAQPHSTVDLKQVVSEVLSDLEVRIEETDGRVELGDLPTIEADPIQMQQLFQNLIGNALKFHRPGETPVVKIYALPGVSSASSETSGPSGSPEEQPGINPGQEFVNIVVEDNGIGFNESYLDRIFQPFQRLHSRSEFEGTGMGLAICRKITDRHGGKISAHSTLGQGTRFVITLPLRQQSSRSGRSTNSP